MNANDADTAANPAFGDAVLEQLMQLWVRPALAARGLDEGMLTQVSVVFTSAGPVVRVNEETQWLGSFRATRDVAAGEPVSASDINDLQALRPAEAGVGEGWAGFVTVGTERYIAFDFRRNRDQASSLLDRAEEFLASARHALDNGRLGATENAYAAVELAVKAGMYLFDDSPPRDHKRRRDQFRAYAELGNAPVEHSLALDELGNARPGARYGDGPLVLTAEQLAVHVAAVAGRIAAVRGESTHPLDDAAEAL